MSMMLRRYRKTTGYARPWVYALFALAFAGLTLWGFAREDWLVAGVALVIAVAAVVLIPVTMRLAAGLDASSARLAADRSEDLSLREES